MVIKHFLAIAAMFVFVSSCNGQKSSGEANKSKATPSFQMVSVPTILTEPEQRAAYLAEHYWDNFDFTDTAYVNLSDVTEQAFVNYLDVLGYTEPPKASESIRHMLAKAEKDSVVFVYFTNLYEKYLYDPNSPMRNEELYIPALRYMVEESSMDEALKIRPAHLLELALKNRIGEQAEDFTYTLAGKRDGSLYKVKADYVLVFFFNPDCHACKEITEQLINSERVSAMSKSGKMKILAIYTDEDIAAWEKHLPEMPSSWIVAYDSSLRLRNDEIYDLKAIPTLYLMDRNKKVLLKDVTYQQLEEALVNM